MSGRKRKKVYNLFPNTKRSIKKKTETNLGTGYSPDSERTMIGGWGPEKQRWMESSNTFLNWVQEDVQYIVKPDNKCI